MLSYSCCPPLSLRQGNEAEERERHDLVEAGRRLDDEGDRVDDAADRGSVAMEATRDDEADRRVAFDLDAVGRVLHADGHRQIERDLDFIAGLNDGDLMKAEDAPRRHTVVLLLRDDGLDR